jgi:hypothetical protein
MRLLRAVLVAFVALMMVLPLRSGPETDAAKSSPKDEPSEKPWQPLFKLDSVFPRPDSPQAWGGFQTQSFVPHGPFLAPLTFSASASTSSGTPALSPASPYGTSPNALLVEESQTRLANYLAAQQTYLAYIQWRNSRSTGPTRAPLPGMGATSGGDACTPGASINAHLGSMIGFRPGNPNSQCFVRGTLVALASGKLQAIESVPLGERVFPEARDDSDPINPAEWRWVEFQAVKRDGSTATIALLRTVTWLQSHQAREGERVSLRLPGCGFDGTATVTAIRACPPIQAGKGSIVTGTIRHSSAAIMHMHIQGLEGPIGTTTAHRFWSADRNGFVRADELLPDERLGSRDGIARVIRLEARPPGEAVYNLEVAGGMYHVSPRGLLVRDAGTGR